MKVINSDNRYDIFTDNIETMDRLPAGTYEITLTKFGKYLNKINDIKAKEKKIYGTHESKCRMILDSFAKANRSLGVILSGTKGSGKSLLMRLICEKSGMPVIVIRQYFSGLIQFLDAIEQECLVIFDEFEKNFPDYCDDSGERGTTQEMLLPLFDGLSSQKKLFIITCNDVNKLNDNYINRPGRFHYHMVFDSPTLEESIEYLNDNVDAKYAANVEEIRDIYHRYKFTYDILRAFAFEFNLGKTISEFISDININAIYEKTMCEVTVTFDDGKVIRAISYLTLSFIFGFHDEKTFSISKDDYYCVFYYSNFVFNNSDGLYHISDPKQAKADYEHKEVFIKDATIKPIIFSGIDQKNKLGAEHICF